MAFVKGNSSGLTMKICNYLIIRMYVRMMANVSGRL